jgi:hypothetical protein
MRLSPLDRHRRNFTTGIARTHLVAGRYGEAVEWAELTLREEPDYRGALVTKTIACAHLNRTEEAGTALRQLLDAQPGLTIARYRGIWMRALCPELLAISLDGLRKAGMPEE